jgi:chromosome segregation ATPase
MADSTTLFNRIGNWFRKGHRADGSELPIRAEITDGDGSEPRSTFLRPWAKRDQAIQNLQNGFTTLTDLMGTIRDSLERQSQRQDELLEYLSHLPQAIQSTTESSKVQSETLRAIHQQIEHQSSQQRQLAEILEKISNTGGHQRELLDELKDRVESLSAHDRAISDTLSNVGTAMQKVSTTSATSAEVLVQMRDQAAAHEASLEKMLAKQNTRFTSMLVIAIFMSIASLVCVAVIGYLLIARQ